MQKLSSQESKFDASRIGIAITTFNSAEHIEQCLSGLKDHNFRVVLFDDGSSDETVVRATRCRPSIDVIHGDGNYWWAGGTKVGVERCFEQGCEYVVMLNPDVTVDAAGIFSLVAYLQEHPRSIAAPLVVEADREDHIAWAGSRFQKLAGLPIYTSRYIAKRGQHASVVGEEPYSVDDVHGRGVVVSRQVYDEIGMFDVDVFPQYGADNDYSLRAISHGIELMVLPSVRVQLDVENTGQPSFSSYSLGERVSQMYHYLTDQKHGDALRVWWMLMKRHVPPHAVVPSFAFNVGLNIARRLR